jgi:hypothetical protein
VRKAKKTIKRRRGRLKKPPSTGCMEGQARIMNKEEKGDS